MAFNWYNLYSFTELTKSLHGRTGMTELYNRDTDGAPAFDYQIDTPTSFSLFRERLYDRIVVFTDSTAVYLQIGTFDNYQGTNLSWKLPSDATNDYFDFRTITTNWVGYIWTGTAPNRVLTIRVEFDTTDSEFNFIPGKIAEYKFYEGQEYVDVHMDATTEEAFSFSFSYGDWWGGVYFDDPNLADPLLPEGDYPIINKTTASTDNKAYRLIMTDAWAEGPISPPPPSPPPPSPPPPVGPPPPPVPPPPLPVLPDGPIWVYTNRDSTIYSKLVLPDIIDSSTDMVIDGTFQNIESGAKELALPFKFKFGDVLYNNVWVSSAGYFTFGDTDGNASLTNTNLSEINPPLDKIFLYGGAGKLLNLYYTTTGTEPDRAFRIRTERLSYVPPPPPPRYSVTSIPNSILGTSGLSPIFTWGGKDDDYGVIAPPFPISFGDGGYSYANFNYYLFVNTNGYISFDSGSIEALSLGPSNPNVYKLFFGAGDWRAINGWRGAEGTAPNRRYRFRLEYSSTKGFTADTVVEIVFHEKVDDQKNTIDIHYGILGSAVLSSVTGTYSPSGTAFSETWTPAEFTSFRLEHADPLPAEYVPRDTISELILYESSNSISVNATVFDVKYGINQSLGGIANAFSNTGTTYIGWQNQANISYRIYRGSPLHRVNADDDIHSDRVGDARPPEYFGRILNYDQVWKDNANIQLAITTADMGYHNVVSNSATIINIQNASNNWLDFTPFYLGENVYTSDANVTFKFTDREFNIYLDTPRGSNGYGFIPGATLTQYCPKVTKTIVLTEPEYLTICGCAACGCTVDSCGCVTGPSTVADRSITVTLANEKVLTATIVRENIDPPYVVVANTDGIFCSNVVTSGSITANVVGVLAPPLKKDSYIGPFLIERPAKYTDNFIDGCGNFIGQDNRGLYYGAHIGLDQHFTYRRSMDHDDMFIVAANWNDTNRNVPMGRILDLWNVESKIYTSIGLAANATSGAIAAGKSKLMEINYTMLSNASFDHVISVTDTGKLDINANPITHHHMKIFNKCHDIVYYGKTADYATTLYTKSYAEHAIQLEVDPDTFEIPSQVYVDEATVYLAPAGGEFDFTEPYVIDPRSNNIYSCTVIAQPGATMYREDFWNATSWPNSGYRKDSNFNSLGAPARYQDWVPIYGWYDEFGEQLYHPGRPISFLSVNSVFANDLFFKSWYGFGSLRGLQYDPYPWYNGYSETNKIYVKFTWPVHNKNSLNPRLWIDVPNDNDKSYINDIYGKGYHNIDYTENAAYRSWLDSNFDISTPDPYFATNPTTFSLDSFIYSAIGISDTFGGPAVKYEATYVIPLDTIIRDLPIEYKQNTYTEYQNTAIFNVDYQSDRIATSITGSATMTYSGNYTGSNTQITLSPSFTINYGGRNVSSIFVNTQEGCVSFGGVGAIIGPALGTSDVIRPLYNTAKYVNDLYYMESGAEPNRYFVIRAECGEYNSATDTVYEISFFEGNLGTSTRFEVQYETVTPVVYDPYPVAISANGKIDIADKDVSNVYWTAATDEGWRMIDKGNRTIEVVEVGIGQYIDIHLGAYWNIDFANESSGYGAPPYDTFTCNVSTRKTFYEFGELTAPANWLDNSTTDDGPNEFATIRCYLDYLKLERKD